MNYSDFIASKRSTHRPTGFINNINYPTLYPFQNHVVSKALRLGKFAIFSGTGTGKTRMQCVWAQEVVKQTGLDVLILAPLAVAGQTIAEAESIGIEVRRWDIDAVEATDEAIYIINYEQIDNISSFENFGGIALDEASILKNHEGAYRNKIIDNCKDIQFKSVWTATPSPNDPMEIGNYSEFLDILPRAEMLAMYFVHDGGETSKWRIKGHGKKVFWSWVSSWATMFQKPADIGFDQAGYDLPELKLIERQITTPKRDNGKLLNDSAVNATTFNKELRLTKIDRLADCVSIINSSTESFIIWIKQNEEGDELRRLLPDAVEVKGSDSVDYKEKMLLGFAQNKFRILITKGKIAGMGLNYQNCHNQIFASPDFSFEMVYQGIRRSWRFRQLYPVNIYLITTDTMQNVIKTIERKQIQFDNMQSEMTNAINDATQKEKYTRPEKQFATDKFTMILGDCVPNMACIPDKSIGFSIFSPPFASLYTYSDQVEDMGNSKDYEEFKTAFSFLVHELYRVLWDGRNIAVHCMDLPIQKGKEGFIGLRDFSGMILKAFEDAGFIYHSRVTLWKNPVTEMQRTKALGLLHKQIKKDAAMSRTGIPDYLLVFRKPGEHLNPVVHQDTDSTKSNYLPVDMWQKYASPVWMDIDYGNTLNERMGREENDERHICPLQLDTIERAYHLWTNEGDTVLTPFAGIGSELYQALKMKRKAIGMELKESYYDIAVTNCKDIELELSQKTLF